MNYWNLLYINIVRAFVDPYGRLFNALRWFRLVDRCTYILTDCLQTVGHLASHLTHLFAHDLNFSEKTKALQLGIVSCLMLTFQLFLSFYVCKINYLRDVIFTIIGFNNIMLFRHSKIYNLFYVVFTIKIYLIDSINN